MDSIVFTEGIATVLKDKLKGISVSDIFVLMDTHSRQYAWERLGLNAISADHLIEMPDGEDHKSLEQVSRIWELLSIHGARRNALLINLGGGVVTDLGGFAASCFKRGIRFWNIPTTLLAQVDASIGGKTGLNFHGLKNEVGTFAQPEWVFIDPHFLSTLPERQWWSGFAEMLKHALLSGREELDQLMAMTRRAVGSDLFLELIRQSVAVKAKIVAADPREKGIRKALNLGHTVGHAIEELAIQKQMECYHGEAVACGLLVALYLSVKKWGFDPKLYEQLQAFMGERYSIPMVIEPEELYALMLHDKKNERPEVNFTLLRSPGEVEINQYCSREEIFEALEQLNIR